MGKSQSLPALSMDFGRSAITASALAVPPLDFDCDVLPVPVERLDGACFRLSHTRMYTSSKFRRHFLGIGDEVRPNTPAFDAGLADRRAMSNGLVPCPVTCNAVWPIGSMPPGRDLSIQMVEVTRLGTSARFEHADIRPRSLPAIDARSRSRKARERRGDITPSVFGDRENGQCGVRAALRAEAKSSGKILISPNRNTAPQASGSSADRGARAVTRGQVDPLPRADSNTG